METSSQVYTRLFLFNQIQQFKLVSPENQLPVSLDSSGSILELITYWGSPRSWKVGHRLWSPDPERLQVRKQLWEESDQVGGGAPGLQVQVFQVRSSVRDHLEVFRLQIHTESQTEEGGREEVGVHRQRMASYWTERVRSSWHHCTISSDVKMFLQWKC